MGTMRAFFKHSVRVLSGFFAGFCPDFMEKVLSLFFMASREGFQSTQIRV